MVKSFQRKVFNVLGKADNYLPQFKLDENQTNHLSHDRISRIERTLAIVGTDAEPIDSFIVDTEHPNGWEVHTIYDNAVIVIRNATTTKLVTILIARPQQIKRYYTDNSYSQELIQLAKKHQEMGMNHF